MLVLVSIQIFVTNSHHIRLKQLLLLRIIIQRILNNPLKLFFFYIILHYIFQSTYAIISVKGVFKEQNQVLYFARNFVLKRLGDEFTIINDQLFVSNPTDFQIGWSFRFPKPDALYPYFGDQYKEMENALRAITNMNAKFCQR